MAQVLLQPGTLVGGSFRVEAVIGRGTYGVVYRATDPAGGDVALKVLGFDPDIYADGAEVFDARVEREIKALRRLNSSSVVRLHDWGMHGDCFYLAMEFVAGRTLAQIIADEGRLDASRVVALAQAILTGLADAHQVGIVHRDLKPENIMVIERATGGEEIRILDFGVARLTARSGNTYETEEGARIFGTPAYMAPEQGLGQVVPQSDQYAVGTIMFEMLVGRLPFDDPQPLQIMIAKLQQPVPPLLEAFGVPPDLVATVHRALARKPADRYVDALSMYRALTNARLDVPQPATLTFGQAPATGETPYPSMQLAATEPQPVVSAPYLTPGPAVEAIDAIADQSWQARARGAVEQLTALGAQLLETPRDRRLAGGAALLMCAMLLLFAGGAASTTPRAAQPGFIPDGSQGGQVRDSLPARRQHDLPAPEGFAVARRADRRQ